MTTKIDNGGPAFPTDTASLHVARGLTTRDYFAAKAMQALIAAYEAPHGATKLIASIAYEFADAMLKVRNEEPTP